LVVVGGGGEVGVNQGDVGSTQRLRCQLGGGDQEPSPPHVYAGGCGCGHCVVKCGVQHTLVAPNPSCNGVSILIWSVDALWVVVRISFLALRGRFFSVAAQQQRPCPASANTKGASHINSHRLTPALAASLQTVPPQCHTTYLGLQSVESKAGLLWAWVGWVSGWVGEGGKGREGEGEGEHATQHSSP
jgi:hypothetical protein